jgi:hypothetical protein
MYELAVVVNFTGEVGVVLLRRFEHDLRAISNLSFLCQTPKIIRTLEPLLSLCDAR